MSQRTYSIVAGLFFAAIALLHAGRLLFGWHITIGNGIVPMWVSWIAIVIAAYLAYQGFKHASTK